MTSTLTPTCALCGLRFENRPLLDLHRCEDHPQRHPTAGPIPGPAANAPAVPAQPGSPDAERLAEAGQQAGTADPWPQPDRRPRGRVTTGLSRITAPFRRANAELMLAWELMVRPIGQARSAPRSGRPAKPDDHQENTRQRIGRAA